MMRSRWFALILLMTSLLSSCLKKETKVSERDQAIELLNKREYLQAIDVLRKLHAQNPNDDHTRLLLASAYCGSIGLNLVDSFSAFQPLLSSNAERSGFGLQETPASESPEERVKGFEYRIIKLGEDIASGLNVALNLPRFGFSQRMYLTEAQLLLKNIKEGSPQFVAARTYATLIHLTQFINFVRDAFPRMNEVSGKSHAKVEVKDMLCHMDVQLFLENIDIAAGYLNDAASQMQLAYEARKKEVPTLLLGLKKSAQAVQTFYREHEGDITASSVSAVVVKNEMCR